MAGLVAAMALVSAGLWRLGRGTTFFYDEWDFVTQRHQGGIDSLLRSHNGHLTLSSAALFRLLLVTVGLGHYGFFRGMVILSHLVCCALLFAYGRRRVGGPLALVGVLALLACGRSWENLLWPFQTTVLLSVAGALGALLLLDRGTRAADAGAACALGLALASFSFGIAVVAGVGAELVVRRRWRRLWIVATPVVLYALWFRVYGGGAKASELRDIPVYVLDAAANGVCGLFGLPKDRMWPLALFLVGLGAAAVLRRRSVDFPRVLMAGVALTAYWTLLALARATQFPDSAASSRYLYPAAAFLLVLVMDAGKATRARPPLVVGLAAVVGLACWSSLDELRQGAAGFRGTSMALKAELAALEVAGKQVDPAFRPDENRAPQIFAGPYFSALEHLGSPVDAFAELRKADPGSRHLADAVLVKALKVQLTAAPMSGCRSGSRVVGAPRQVVPLPAAGVVIRTGSGVADLRLWRFGPLPDEPFAHMEPGSSAMLQIRPDQNPEPWKINVRATGSASLCLLDGTS